MSKPKARATRDETGTWRKASAEVDKPAEWATEHEGPGGLISGDFDSGVGLTEVDRIGEAVVKKPHTVSVARPTRGRPRKAKSPTGTKAPTDALRRGYFISEGFVIFVSLLLGLVVLNLAVQIDIGEEGSKRRLDTEHLTPGLVTANLLMKKIRPWVGRVRQTKATVETVDTTLFVEKIVVPKEVVPKTCDCVSPQCPPYVETTAGTHYQADAAARSQNLIPPFLEPYLAHTPPVRYIYQFLDFSAENVVKHPWVFLLLLSCAAWKILELTLPRGNAAFAYVSTRLKRFSFARAGHLVDEESERAKKEAGQALLMAKLTTGKGDTSPPEDKPE